MTEQQPSQDRFEIDLGSYLRAVAGSWWLVLLCVIVGAAFGVGALLAQPDRYDAQSSVYLGQPTDANGNAISGVNSNPRAAAQIVQSQQALQAAAAAAGDGLTVRTLRNNLTIEMPTVTVKSTSAPTNFVVITVRDAKAARAAKAANALAEYLLGKISGYADKKIALLEERQRKDQAMLAAMRGRLTASDQIALSADIEDTRLALEVANGIEKPALLTEAEAPDTPAATSVLLGAAAGLVAGLVVGLVVVAFRRRRPQA